MPPTTPLLSQYHEIKGHYPDTLLLFQMGDFYELFYEDAEVASRELDIALTSRNRETDEGRVPLAGFPIHAASGYISRLVKQGYRVAVCEQVEDAAPGKKLVRREVTRLVTPGVDLETDNLKRAEHHYLLGLKRGEGNRWGLAVADISTGDFRVAEGKGPALLAEEIRRMNPREILVAEREDIPGLLGDVPVPLTRRPRDYFSHRRAHTALCRHFGTASLDPFGVGGYKPGIEAAGAVFQYLKESQGVGLDHIRGIRPVFLEQHVIIDAHTRRNLELLEPLPRGDPRGTLMAVIDRTGTGMGGRRLREWLLYPLLDVEKIGERLEAVDEFVRNPSVRAGVHSALAEVRDIERLMSRVTLGRANPRDLVMLRDSLAELPGIREKLSNFSSPLLTKTCTAVGEHPEIRELLSRALRDDPPIVLKEGGIIRDGYHPELDRIRSLSRDAKNWVVRFEEEEKRRTGIGSLKVGYNKVFGYYIEVTRTNLKNVPASYERKQTLANAERFITDDLKRTEAEILGADQRIRDLEYELFQEIRGQVAGAGEEIQRTAAALADFDALAALAEAAAENRYVRPRVEESGVIEIKEGRHPVIERMGFREPFVPNNLFLDRDRDQVLIITGPNMAGKSTLMRQAALIVILAQMGSFVPAAEARVGVVDRIFTRIGSGDSLARGQSTFLIEMNETAEIVRNATPGSLIILDEIGRGTSTFDGLSIAWAVAEYIHDRVGARTLFATHYHELTRLEEEKPRVKNYSLAVKEWQGEIIFLRKLIPGGTSLSYGVEVARLAGLPDKLLGRAREILKRLEGSELELGPEPDEDEKSEKQMRLFHIEDEWLQKKVGSLDLDRLSPIEALHVLNELKQEIQRRKGEKKE